jgi:cytochrome P450
MTTVRLPPGPTTPRIVQSAFALTSPQRALRRLRARYGDAFTVNVPIFGRAVVISDPAAVKRLFTAGPDVVDNLQPNLGRVLGPGSLFALTGDEHRKQRKLLTPPFHGRRLAAYERIVEEETVRELATWPAGRPFATQPSMMRITLNAILRAVFGAEGAELARLRELLPRIVALGSRRCLGAAFAAMEMNVVLRTMVRDFTLIPTTERDERWHFRGVAYAPAKGGRAVVRRRTARPAAETVSTQREALR